MRIGVILDEDRQQAVELTIPPEGAAYRTDDGETCTLPAGGRASVGWEAGGLICRAGDAPPRRVRRVCVWAAESRPLSRGAGVVVHDIVAGRGFHWQKRLTQRLAGVLEFLPGATGVVLVNELPLEEYLAGVITAEMGAACPHDLLAAQCVVARSWLLAFTEPKHDADPFDRCNDDCCQRYQGTAELSEAAIAAVRGTRGQVLLDKVSGGVVDANYSKSCGGISEPELLWGKPKPGLGVVVDAPEGSALGKFLPVTGANLDAYLDGDWVRSTDAYCSPNVVPESSFGAYLGRVDEQTSYFRWTVTQSRAELEALLREKTPELADLAELRGFKVIARGPSGRVHILDVEYADRGGKTRQYRLPSEYRIRAALHSKFLYSSAFAIRTTSDESGRPERITLRGAGWGHGAGLCQIGALGMALVGEKYERICLHYFPGAEMGRVYE